MSEVIKPKRFIKTVSGEEVEVPKLVWAREKLALGALKDALEKFQSDKRLEGLVNSVGETTFPQLLPLLLDYAPDAATTVSYTHLTLPTICSV